MMDDEFMASMADEIIAEARRRGCNCPTVGVTWTPIPSPIPALPAHQASLTHRTKCPLVLMANAHLN